MLVTAPALAEDAVLPIDRAATSHDPDARAHWDDLTDNLCVNALSGIAYAEIQKHNGNWVKVEDNNSLDNERRCTGNLVIDEDYYTTMRVCHQIPTRLPWACESRRVYT